MEARVESKSFLYDVLLPRMEIAAWVLAIWGFIARWNLLSGGAMFLIIGLSTLSMASFLSAFKPRDLTTTNGPYFEPVSSQQQFSDVLGKPSFLLDILLPKNVGIGGAVVFIGTLFKLLFWLGSAKLLVVGTATMLVIVVLMVLNQRLSRRAMLMAAIGMIMLYVPSETWVRQFHRDDPELIALMVNQLHHPHDRAAAEAVRAHMHQKSAQR